MHTLAWIAVLLACSGPGATTTATSTTTVTSTETGESATTTASTDATLSTTSTSTTADDTTTACSFLCGPDGGDDHLQCDPFAQDCPEGEKCSAWADGGGAWNATKCVPVDPDPDAVGEPCTIMETGLSGLDSCDKGAMCYFVDYETMIGTCTPLCLGPVDTCLRDLWTCCPAGSICQLNSTGTLNLCFPVCSPLLQDCPEGTSCYVIGGAFQCSGPGSGEMGVAGDPCDFLSTCAAGSYCGDPESFPGCDPMAGGCCIPFCDLNAPACPPETECVPWFDDPPPTFESLGSCTLPA